MEEELPSRGSGQSVASTLVAGSGTGQLGRTGRRLQKQERLIKKGERGIKPGRFTNAELLLGVGGWSRRRNKERRVLTVSRTKREAQKWCAMPH